MTIFERAENAIEAATTADTIVGIRKRIATAVENWELTDSQGDDLDRLAVRRLAAITGTTTADNVPAPASTESDDREIVPVGEQTMEIVRYDRGPVEWKKNGKNPTGDCHRFRLRQGGRRFIFEDVPATLTGLVKGIEAAVGQPLDESVGVEVQVVVKHITTKAGEVRAVVEKWVTPPATSKSTAKPAAAVKVSRNAPPEGDDVAF